MLIGDELGESSPAAPFAAAHYVTKNAAVGHYGVHNGRSNGWSHCWFLNTSDVQAERERNEKQKTENAGIGK